MTTTRLALLLGCALGALTTVVACAPCADCCPPGSGSTTAAVTVACQVTRPDGGPAGGLGARCLYSDAGATTDGDGRFSFSVNRLTCGFAAGSDDCGQVQFLEDGGLLTVALPTDPDSGVTQVPAWAMIGGSCRLSTR